MASDRQKAVRTGDPTSGFQVAHFLPEWPIHGLAGDQPNRKEIADGLIGGGLVSAPNHLVIDFAKIH
jgi:hypothetical protein